MPVSIVVSTATSQTIWQPHIADVQLAFGAFPIRLGRAPAVIVSFAYLLAVVVGAVGRCRLVLSDGFAHLITFTTFA